MPLTKRRSSSTRAMTQDRSVDQGKDCKPQIAEPLECDGRLNRSPVSIGNKRERQKNDAGSTLKSAKIDSKSDVKVENGSEACFEGERRQKFQRLIEDVYFQESSRKNDATQCQNASSLSPSSHFSAENLSLFMESFERSFPSDCNHLMALLDAFLERRCAKLYLLIDCKLKLMPGLPPFAPELQFFSRI